MRGPVPRPASGRKEERLQCAICGKECHQAYLRLGGYCSEEHREELLQRHRRQLEELRREELQAMPDTLGVPDFERLALKLAVHLLVAMRPETVRRYQEAAPWLLDPLEMAAELKGRILRELPGTHVLLEEAVGHQRLFHDGTYSFRQPIRAPLMREALDRARVWPQAE